MRRTLYLNLLLLTILCSCRKESEEPGYRKALVEWWKYPGKLSREKVYDEKIIEGQIIIDRNTNDMGKIYKFYNTEGEADSIIKNYDKQNEIELTF